MAFIIPKRGSPLAAVVLVAVVIALVASGCGRTGPPYNVLLISVDTLRPDHLGYAGHTRDTSPTVDRLAREGVVFTNAYSVAGWTLPSMASVMTGQYPRDHGATDFHYGVDLSLPTLAGILRRNGYDTRGYVSHVVLTPVMGMAEGFGRFDHSVLNVGHPHEISSGEPLTDIVIRDLDDIEAPFFLWVHYFDPHFQYLWHEKWGKFGNAPIDRYDQEIAFTDEQIGRLLKALSRKRLLKNTIVVFVSDHGEEFQEHGAQYHYTLYQEVLRIPLVVKAPFLEPGVNGTVTDQVDLLPTILTMVGINPSQYGDFPGRDLFAGAAPVDDAKPRPVFLERDRPPPYNQRGVLLGKYKLTVIEEADWSTVPETSRGTEVPITNVNPGIYMYDLEADPGEKTNIYSDDHRQARELLALLADHFAGAHAPIREVEIDESLRKKLRSLGYIH